MGYSARYHAASLAAVFLALAVGILIGAGFGSDIVTGTADDLEQSLASDLDEERAKVDDLEGQLADERDFAQRLTPAVVANRLRGREIGVVALGGLDDALVDDVRAAIDPAGGDLSEIAVIREPPDVEAAVQQGSNGRGGQQSRSEALGRAARRAGRALVRGGDDFADLRAALFSRYSGQPGDLDGVVIVRQRPQDMGARDEANTDTIEDGLIAGLRSALSGHRVTIAGAERTATDPSSVPFFSDHDLPSVDNVDQLAGQVSLVYVLGGAEGRFGVKDSADAQLPDLLEPSNLQFGAEKRP
jgi:Copper transport outer membrane protein, MctB